MAPGKRNMVKPNIGVTLSARRSTLVWLMHKLAVYRAGGIPHKITAQSGCDVDLDGYIIGGGDDIGLDLKADGIEPTVRIDRERDALEQATLNHAFEANKPVLGICRGAQMINVARGGSLYADLSEYRSDLTGRRFILPKKQIQVEKPSMLYRLLSRTSLAINALHHQSVRTLGEDLTVVATDSDDIVQAIECQKSGNLLGVQWHPELIPWSASHMALFRWVVSRARVGTNAIA